MIKKSIFENDIIDGMQKELSSIKPEDNDRLDGAVDNIHSAIQIFEDTGMFNHANSLLNVLSKIAKKHKKKNKELTSEQMIKNLLDHGTEFDLSDDGGIDDLLNADVEDNLEIDENFPEMDFEDEI